MQGGNYIPGIDRMLEAVAGVAMLGVMVITVFAVVLICRLIVGMGRGA